MSWKFTETPQYGVVKKRFDSSRYFYPIRRAVKIIKIMRMNGATSRKLTRRKVLRHLLGIGVCLPVAKLLSALPKAEQEHHTVPARPPSLSSTLARR